MICPICNGRRYVYNALGSFYEDCGHCKGTGKVRAIGEPMTNEEYMKTLSTEMFAVAIYNAIIQGAVRINCDITIEYRSGTELKEAIYEWLQQPHKD